MKLTDRDLRHQRLEIRARDGGIRQVEPFAPHECPDQPKMETFEIPLPGGPRKIEADVSEHGNHAVVLQGQDGFEDKTFLVRCDGTIISVGD